MVASTRRTNRVTFPKKPILLLVAAVEEALLLFLGEAGVAVLAYLVEDAVDFLLCGLLVGVVVPVGLLVHRLVLALAPLPSLAQSLEELKPYREK